MCLLKQRTPASGTWTQALHGVGSKTNTPDVTDDNWCFMVTLGRHDASIQPDIKHLRWTRGVKSFLTAQFVTERGTRSRHLTRADGARQSVKAVHLRQPLRVQPFNRGSVLGGWGTNFPHLQADCDLLRENWREDVWVHSFLTPMIFRWTPFLDWFLILRTVLEWGPWRPLVWAEETTHFLLQHRKGKQGERSINSP